MKIDKNEKVTKEVQKREEELVAEAVIVPPDGGWGWMIVIASFFTNAVVDGIIFTVGQGLLPIWEEEFTEGSSSMAAWALSLLSGCYLLVGPIVSSVANVFGCRITAMIGTFIACAGFILSMFATNIWFLYLTFGLLGGVGLGFVYLPSIVIVSYYFEKRRALATGVAVCGSGIGTFLCAPFIRFLLEHFTWRQTMLFLSGIVLHCLVFASFYRTLKPSKRQIAEISQKLHAYDEEQHKSSNMDLSTAKNSDTTQPFEQPNGDVVEADDAYSKITSPNGSLLAPNVKFERFRSGDSESSTIKRRRKSSAHRVFRSTMDLSHYRKRTHPLEGHYKHRIRDILPAKQDAESADNTDMDQEPIFEAVSKRSVALLNRPLSRMDIFYSGSVQNLPQFKSQPDVRRFLASTISIPVALEQEGPGKAVPDVEESAKKGIRDTLRNLLDFSLFASPTFIILALSGFFTLTGFFVPFIYLPKMAESFGHSSQRATLLVSALGVTNIVARILCGYISDGLPRFLRCHRRRRAKGGDDEPPRSPALFINNAALILAGLATMMVPHWRSYGLLILYCVIFGTGTACFASLRSVICVQLLGLERLTNAYGLLLLFMGVASLIGSPIAGSLFDQTKTFNLSFYVMGALVAVSGLLGIPLPYISEWEKRRSGKLVRAASSSPDSSEPESDDDDESRVAVAKKIAGPPQIVVYRAPETLTEDDEEANAQSITSAAGKAFKNAANSVQTTA